MPCLYWGCALAQTDIGGLWAVAKIRPRWYWTLRRLYLAWRLWTPLLRVPPEEYELDWTTAWDVASVVYAHALVGPCKVHRRRKDTR